MRVSAIFVGIAIAFFVVALEDAERETVENFVIALLASVPLYVAFNIFIDKIIGWFIKRRLCSLYETMDRKKLERKIIKEGKMISTALIVTSLIITIILTKAFLQLFF